MGFPGGAVIKSPKGRRCGVSPWVRKIPWRKWQPTPVSLPRKSHGWEAWWATVHGVAKSRTWLSDWAHTCARTHTHKPTNPRSSMNRELKKHEETYITAHHNQVVLKPLTKRKVLKAARKNTYTHIIYRGTKTSMILDLEICTRRQ